MASAFELRQFQGKLSANVWNATQKIGKIAQDEGRWVIEHSPTKGDWSERFRKNPRWEETVRRSTGRVETGSMRDDYTYKVNKQGGRNYKIQVGWVGGDPLGYYEDQEWGFEWSGFKGGGGVQIMVPGMFAQDRSQPVVDEFAVQTLENLEKRMNS